LLAAIPRLLDFAKGLMDSQSRPDPVGASKKAWSAIRAWMAQEFVEPFKESYKALPEEMKNLLRSDDPRFIWVKPRMLGIVNQWLREHQLPTLPTWLVTPQYISYKKVLNHLTGAGPTEQRKMWDDWRAGMPGKERPMPQLNPTETIAPPSEHPLTQLLPEPWRRQVRKFPSPAMEPARASSEKWSRTAGEIPEALEDGMADGKPDSDFDPEQLEKGIKVEMEHTKDKDIARKIAKDHLTEFSHYYDALERMERELEEEEQDEWNDEDDEGEGVED
jgi:hypothetical protein